MLGYWNLNVMVHIFHLRHLRGRDRGDETMPNSSSTEMQKSRLVSDLDMLLLLHWHRDLPSMQQKL